MKTGSSTPDGFERALAALDWWRQCSDQPTSSLTGGGAIRCLELWLGRRLNGLAVALPSGTAAVRAGLQVLGAGPGNAVEVLPGEWFGATGAVSSIAPVASHGCPVAVRLATWPATPDGVAAMPTLLDAANAGVAEYAAIATGPWQAIALSFGPGKTIDAGEGGALIVRTRAHWRDVVRATQHPVRQRLEGIADPDVTRPCERIHPVAAVTALHLLCERWALVSRS